MRHILCFLMGIFLFSTVAEAQVIGGCKDLTDPSYVVKKGKSFEKGRIQLVHVDTDGEPVCCSSRLLIKVKLGKATKCFAFGSSLYDDGGVKGYSDIKYSGISIDDAAAGIFVTVPFEDYGSGSGEASIKINLDESDFSVSVVE